MIFELKKTKEIIQAIKHFSLTKYLLNKKEENLLQDIEHNEGMIESHKQRILAAGERIIDYEEAIIEAQKLIKRLEADVKKIQKVLKLY